MGVDARMVVHLVAPISDEELIDASYRLSEAVGHRSHVFWLSDDEDIAKGEIRRALNRVTSDEEGEYRACGVAAADGRWLWVSLWGRYYGDRYERGDLWSFVAIAEWLEANFPGCLVFYGGDSGETIDIFNLGARRRLIAHWTKHGGRPYYASEGKSYGSWCGTEREHLRPMCPLCQHKATQYGRGGQFASWTCDGCARHWVWIGRDVRAYPPSSDWDSFAAAKAQREEAAEAVGHE